MLFPVSSVQIYCLLIRLYVSSAVDKTVSKHFDVLLTVHLGTVLVTDQRDAQNQFSPNLCTGRPPTGVMIPDAV